MGCQGLSRVVDHKVAELKRECVFNFTDNLVVYSLSVSEHCHPVREGLGTIQSEGFALNRGSPGSQRRNDITCMRRSWRLCSIEKRARSYLEQ
jgi:hypothetical protein